MVQARATTAPRHGEQGDSSEAKRRHKQSRRTLGRVQVPDEIKEGHMLLSSWPKTFTSFHKYHPKAFFRNPQNVSDSES